MENKEMPIHLLPESRHKINIKAPGTARPIYWGLVFLAVAGLAYGGLRYYLSSQQTQLTQLDNDLVALEKKRDKSFEKELLDLNRRLSLASTLIKDHFVWTRVLDKLESLTPEAVEISFLSTNASDNHIDLKATAPSFSVIARQIAALAGNEAFSDVALNKVSSLPSGFLEYDLRVIFYRSKLLLNVTDDKKTNL